MNGHEYEKVPIKVIRLLYEWWCNATGIKRELIDPIRLNSYAAVDLIRDKKWCPRVRNMAVAIETNNAYLDIHFPEDICAINKIISAEDPDHPWVEQQQQDPPEDESQFFTLDPGDKTEDQIRSLIEQKLHESVCKGQLRKELVDVVRNRANTFLTKGCPIQKLVNHYHKIETQGEPFAEKFFRMSTEQKEVLQKEIDQMLAMGVIEKIDSGSPWASRMLLVKKPDTTLRPCVDYRRLNAQTKRDSSPLPNIDDLLANVSRRKIYTQVDLYSGFWQIPLREEDKPKTAFITPMGLFQWTVMPFGLMNAPATFQTFMEKVLKPVLHDIVEVYIDDIVIFSENEEEHAKHVKIVFDLLHEAGLKMKIDKCHFGVKNMNFLGFNFSPEGLRPQPDKIKAVVEAKVTKSVTGILRFLGLVRYYQRFVPHLAELAQPLTALLRKERSPKEWGKDQDEAVQKIKEVFQSSALLTHFDPI